MSAQTLETITGVVERLTFQAPNTGFTVLRLQLSDRDDPVVAVGTFAAIRPGQTLELTGNWRDHPRYGQQFQVELYAEARPATLVGIEKYLGSGQIEGIGPKLARRIVAHFGPDTLDILEADPDRLGEIPGIGQLRIERLKVAWAEQRAIKSVMIFLQGHGVSTAFAVKIFQKYGEEAIARVKANPYALAADIAGIGFPSADRLARQLGIGPDSPARYAAALRNVLAEATANGHCCLPMQELVALAITRLTTEDHRPEAAAVTAAVGSLAVAQRLTLQTDRPLCFLPSYARAEAELAERLAQHLAVPVDADLPRIRNWLERVAEKTNLKLSDEQQQAVETAATSRIAILTGGPGTGKTFTTRTIVALWQAMGKTIALAAPTGRAAQRLSALAGQDAQTLHRLLAFDPRTAQFQRNTDRPLECDAAIVDEASMLDLFLGRALLRALPAGAQLLLVGDVDQLPSVGPGRVLRDLIETDCIPVVRLSQVFRQAAQSAIVRAAHQINQGSVPDCERLSYAPQSNALWYPSSDPEAIAPTIRELVDNFLPGLGFTARTDVQVLAPMQRGPIGTKRLNELLQGWLNPPSDDLCELARGETVFREGDRVIQLKNDYDKDVFNGDLGSVTEIDPDERRVTVAFNNRLIDYDASELEALAPAWCITVHKAQGSEYPVVVLPFVRDRGPWLSRNLLYTGLTRAKRLAIILGSREILAAAVASERPMQRHTLLPERLKGEVERARLGKPHLVKLEEFAGLTLEDLATYGFDEGIPIAEGFQEDFRP